ncbi:MAG: cyanophycinase, partial [Gemmatimonadota bacterium]|nr:cyanophycinase [Gemmatimonadota bacterium]
FVIVPTAGGNRRADGTPIVYDEAEVVAPFKVYGLTNVHMLHTHDPKVADTEAFAAMLKDANAVWFVGGRQWNIVDSYAGTRTLAAFQDVLRRGGVIGGSSAGATIQGDYLVRGATAGAQIMMTDEPNHQNGFAFLRGSAIDQHINTRNRWDDLIPVIAKYPNLLGIGISEGTAIVVDGDRFEVIGRWKVAIHDNTRVTQPWEKSWFVLGAGDVYDMKARRVVSYGTTPLPPRP